MKKESNQFCVAQQYICFVFLSVCANGTYYLYTQELPDALLEHNGVVHNLDPCPSPGVPFTPPDLGVG